MATTFSSTELFTHKGKQDFLGRGSYGTVCRCFQNDGSVHAVKLLNITGGRSEIEDNEKAIEKEAEILQEMSKSDYVVNIRGIVTFEDYQVGVVMEYMPRGNLSELMKPELSVPLSLRLRILFETASGLNHLHSATFDKRISHNDLKPTNVLLDSDFHAKICDFGGSDFAPRTSISCLGGESKVHTVNYAAPEILNDSYTRRTRAMDVYSFGMVIFFVLKEDNPFPNASSEYVISMITSSKRPKLDEKDCKLNLESEVDKKIFKDLRFTMKECWEQEAIERPEIKTVRDDLKNLYDSKELNGDNNIKVEIDRAVSDLKQRLTLNESQRDDDCDNLESKFIKMLHQCWPKEPKKQTIGDNDDKLTSYNKPVREVHKNIEEVRSEPAMLSEPPHGQITGRPVHMNTISIDTLLQYNLNSGDKFMMDTPNAMFECEVRRVYDKRPRDDKAFDGPSANPKEDLSFMLSGQQP